MIDLTPVVGESALSSRNEEKDLKKNEVSVLQSDLNSIERWSVNNNMKLNGKKCKEMIVSFARSENDIPRLLIDGQVYL